MKTQADAPTPRTDALAKELYGGGVDEHYDGTRFRQLAKELERELAAEREARERAEASIPLIDGRVKNDAHKLIGEVLRHSDGPNNASHGCVEATKVLSEIELLIAERNSFATRAEQAAARLAEAMDWIRNSRPIGGLNPPHNQANRFCPCPRCQFISSTEPPALLKEIQEFRAKLNMAKEALNQIASWSEGETVIGSFDEPGSAKTARETLTKIT